MKKDADLVPPDSFKIALGELLLQNFKLTLKKQPFAKTFRELGSVFCDVFNDKPGTPTISEATLIDLHDSLVEINGGPNVMMSFVRAALSQNDPSIMERDASDFVQDEELLNKTSILLRKVRQEGLTSVMTPEIAHRLTKSRLLVEAESTPTQSESIHNKESQAPKIGSLENWLVSRISELRIPKESTSPEDSLASCIMATTYVVKAMDKANLLKRFLAYSMKQQHSAMTSDIQSLVKSGKFKPVNRAAEDTDFLLHLDLCNPDFIKETKSILGIALSTYMKSEQSLEDIITVMKYLMPYVGILRDFLNLAQLEQISAIKKTLFDLTKAEWKYNTTKGVCYTMGEKIRLSELKTIFSEQQVEAKEFGADANQQYYLVYHAEDMTLEKLSTIDPKCFSSAASVKKA